MRVEESACSDGRADLVWVRFDQGWDCEILKANALALTNPTTSRILSSLQTAGHLSEADLLLRIGVTRDVLRKSLRILAEGSLLEMSKAKLYRLPSIVKFPKIEICSFELKLDDWRRALYQSTRYKSFSHRVFVVMPQKSAESVLKQKDRFEKLDIGLISHEMDGSSRVLIRPTKKIPTSSYRSLMALGMALTRGEYLKSNESLQHA